jgi:hypothetical protein
LSNYIDEAVEPAFRRRTEAHFHVCKHCAAVLDGTRNVIRLVGDGRVFDMPAGFGERPKASLGLCVDASNRDATEVPQLKLLQRKPIVVTFPYLVRLTQVTQSIKMDLTNLGGRVPFVADATLINY